MKSKMPLSAPVELRRDAKSETTLKTFVEQLLRGPFNALMSTVVKDLEGFAFGSNAFNAGKVLQQDHTFFAATSAWVLQAHILSQQQIRAVDAKMDFDVGPVGALAEAPVFAIATYAVLWDRPSEGWRRGRSVTRARMGSETRRVCAVCTVCSVRVAAGG
jgi:hypothetical protein